MRQEGEAKVRLVRGRPWALQILLTVDHVHDDERILPEILKHLLIARIATTGTELAMSEVQRYLLTVNTDKPKALEIARDTAKRTRFNSHPRLESKAENIIQDLKRSIQP